MMTSREIGHLVRVSSRRRKRNGFLLLQLLRSVVRLGGFRLDHDRGVAALVEFRPVGYGPYYVAGREPEGCAQGSQCRDEHRDDDFDDLFPCHNGCDFSFDEGQYK